MTEAARPSADAIRDRLRESLGLVFYSDLRAHLVRDAVFLVAKGVDLLECGVAIATDDVAKVQPWIEQGALRKPTREERATWANAAEREWRSLVVQPYVLVQDP